MWSEAVKYLGVILYHRLTFTRHVNTINNKAIGLLIKLYPLLNKKSKLSIKNKLNLFNTIIRPVLSYACPAWNLISETNFNKIQVTQNKFLRLIGVYRMFTPIHTMHKELGVEMFRNYVKIKSQNYFDRINSQKNNLVKNIPYTACHKKHRQIMHIIHSN